MRDATCEADCGNRNALTHVCEWAKRGHAPCAYGLFVTTVERMLGDLGDWRVMQYKDGPCKATLRGPRGTVEVWGGTAHASEVWFVERGTKAETPLCESWCVEDGSLREAVERGCAMAGIQPRMPL